MKLGSIPPRTVLILAAVFPALFGPLIADACAEESNHAKPICDPELRKAVEAGIKRGVEYLKASQREDGSWDPGKDTKQAGGITAVVVYALAASGVPASDASITRGLEWIDRSGTYFRAGATYGTYSGSLLLLALVRVDAQTHEERIRKIANDLVLGQNKSGAWGYRLQRGKEGDPSNTYHALLALRAAEAHTAFRAPKSTWKHAAAWIRARQLPDGGWGYRTESERSYGSPRPYGAMTASCVFGLVACEGSLDSFESARTSAAAQRGLQLILKEANRSSNGWNPYGAFTFESAAAVFDLDPERWYPPMAPTLSRLGGGVNRWHHLPIHARTGVYFTAMAVLALSRATPPAIFPAGKADGKTASAARFPAEVNASNLKTAFEAYLLAGKQERVALAPRFGQAGRSVIEFLIARLGEPDKDVRVVAYGLLDALLEKPLLFDPVAADQERNTMLESIRRHWAESGTQYSWDPAKQLFRR